jgi:dipeptide/tripeptide permease
MAINVGSLFAPTAALGIMDWAQDSLGLSVNTSYHFAFAVACVALIASMGIYYAFRPTFKHVEGGERKKGDVQVEDTLTPAETKSRITALVLVFAVVIFFWMAFHQNGLTLTYYADEFTVTEAFGATTMLFNVWNLALIIVAVYATFSIFQSEKATGKLTSGAIATAILGYLVYRATGSADASCAVNAPIFQQFNPFYVVALTPVSMAIFGALAKKGKEPSAPRKIAYGMLVAAIGFAIMAVGSRDLNSPKDQAAAIAINKGETIATEYVTVQNDTTMTAEAKTAALAKVEKSKSDFEGKVTKDSKALFTEVYDLTVAGNTAELAAIKAEHKPETRTSSYWLIFTYLIRTFAELLLSPMGISFVSKVAPPKYKGMMMGGWFVATAIGNFLVSVGGFLWGGLSLTIVWSVFIALCLLSALFMFVMMKRLESATK